MNGYELPSSLEIGGEGFSIRSDYRAILDILGYCSSPDYEDDEKAMIMLNIFYEDFDRMKPENYREAMEKAVDFIDYGHSDKTKKSSCLMDWEQDSKYIIAAVNDVAKTEIRALPYLHWWTFLGYYISIGDSMFSQIVSIRSKKAKGQKLTKEETAFYTANIDDIKLKRRMSKEEKDEADMLRKILYGGESNGI